MNNHIEDETHDEEVHEEIDLSEYEIPADEQDALPSVGLLNTFHIYYKRIHNKPDNTSMFDGIDDDNEISTNTETEMLYSMIYKYKNNTDLSLSRLNDMNVDIEKYAELYVLSIEGEYIKTCGLLFPLFEYLVSLDWYKIDWQIIKIK